MHQEGQDLTKGMTTVAGEALWLNGQGTDENDLDAIYRPPSVGGNTSAPVNLQVTVHVATAYGSISLGEPVNYSLATLDARAADTAGFDQSCNESTSIGISIDMPGSGQLVEELQNLINIGSSAVSTIASQLGSPTAQGSSQPAACGSPATLGAALAQFLNSASSSGSSVQSQGGSPTPQNSSQQATCGTPGSLGAALGQSRNIQNVGMLGSAVPFQVYCDTFSWQQQTSAAVEYQVRVSPHIRVLDTGVGGTVAIAVSFAQVVITATAPAASSTQPSVANQTQSTGTISPHISAISPANGAVGTTVTITGTGFTNVTGVTFGSKAATYTVVSPTSIRATVPDVSSADKTFATLGSPLTARVAVIVTTASGSANSLFNYAGPK
jgi:hypothetical protein